MTEDAIIDEAVYLLKEGFEVHEVKVELRKLEADTASIEAICKNVVMYSAQLELAKQQKSKALIYVVLGVIGIVFSFIVFIGSMGVLFYGLLLGSVFIVLVNYNTYKRSLSVQVGKRYSIRSKRLRSKL